MNAAPGLDRRENDKSIYDQMHRNRNDKEREGGGATNKKYTEVKTQDGEETY